jgi:hypothetical protein
MRVSLMPLKMRCDRAYSGPPLLVTDGDRADSVVLLCYRIQQRIGMRKIRTPPTYDLNPPHGARSLGPARLGAQCCGGSVWSSRRGRLRS